jgi:pentose-5-phosphate-3-epimerase
MKVTVQDGWQVKHGGKNYTGGDSFDASDAEGKKLVAAGLVKAVAGSKNKAVTVEQTDTKADGGLADLSVKELQKMAADAEVEGRSSMTKDELVAALGG